MEGRLLRDPTTANILSYYGRAIHEQDSDLEQTCGRLLDCHFPRIIRSKEFKEIDAKSLCRILKRDTLRGRESKIYDAVLAWSEAECQRLKLDPTAENRRKVLEKPLEVIRFALMTPEEVEARMNDGFFPKDTNNSDDEGPKQKKQKLDRAEKPRNFALKKHVVKRFSELGKTGGVIRNFTEDGKFQCEVEIKSDKLVFLLGVRAFGARGPYGDGDSVTTQVTVHVFERNSKGSLWLTSGSASVERWEKVPGNNDVLVDVDFGKDGPAAIRPGATYVIKVEGTIRCTNEPHHEGWMDLDAKYVKEALPVVTVGRADAKKVANVKIKTPKITTKAKERERFALGNLPELIFSF